MPAMWMDVDVALSEVPVNIMPLTSDTDFKTVDEGIAYDESNMALYWHFTTTTGATSVTAVVPTTGGVHDWAHQDHGMYTIEIPDTGGTINNDTEGFGYFTGQCDAVLPWRGPTIGFRAAALNNALIDGGDYLEVDQLQLGGSTQSATDLKDFADTGYDPTAHKVQGVVLTDTCTANSDMRGTDSANTTVPDEAGTAAALLGTLETHGDSTWATATSVTVSDKTGFKLASDGLAAVTAWTVNITGNITGNLSGSVGTLSGLASASAAKLDDILDGTGGTGLKLSTLEITGTTTLTGAVSLASTLGVTGAVTLSSTLSTGVVTLSGLAITNALSVGTTTTLTGAVSCPAGIAANITGNVTGNLSGSVGSVTDGVTLGADAITAANIADDAFASEHFATGCLTADAFAANALVAASFASDVAISFADALLIRDVDNVEDATGADGDTLCTAILGALHWSTSGTSLIIKKTDGTTNHATLEMTTDADAEPTTGVN